MMELLNYRSQPLKNMKKDMNTSQENITSIKLKKDSMSKAIKADRFQLIKMLSNLYAKEI
jgi:ABC-type lipoprotein release transport system permease subunit